MYKSDATIVYIYDDDEKQSVYTVMYKLHKDVATVTQPSHHSNNKVCFRFVCSITVVLRFKGKIVIRKSVVA